MSKTGSATSGRNRLKIVNPELVPAGRYYDPEFYAAECEEMWSRVWQMACRLERIPNVGDWVEYSNVGRSVIVVRTESGVKAYENHCRHRGVKLAGRKGKDHGNCAKMGFICPFHGWRWNMDGENTFVYGPDKFSPELLDPAEIALKPVRTETWGGCVFINHDPDAASLVETLGPGLANIDAYGISDVRAQWWFATEIPSNWKIAMEAFMEAYHVMATHPQLQNATPEFYNGRYGDDTGGLAPRIDPDRPVNEALAGFVDYLDLVDSGMGGGMCQDKEMEIVKSFKDFDLSDSFAETLPRWQLAILKKIVEDLRQRGEDIPDLEAAKSKSPVRTSEFVFPNYFTLRVFTSYTTYRIRPLGPEKCLFEIWALTHFPEGEEPETPTAPTMLPYDSTDFPLIPQQDYANIPLQQEGLHSPGFEAMRLSKVHEGLISNYQRVIDGFIEHAPQERVRAAIHQLAGNFDGPIKDLGL